MDCSPDLVSQKFVTKFSDGLFTKFGDLENSSPNLVINPLQKLTLNTLKLIPHNVNFQGQSRNRLKCEGIQGQHWCKVRSSEACGRLTLTLLM